MQYLSKGKRSTVYLVRIKNKKYVKKIAKEWTIQNEVKWLKLLNKHKIGPKLISFGKDCLIEEYIEGLTINEFLKKANKMNIKKVILNCLNQCFTLDKLKVNKFELTNPYKHIIITKNLKSIMIDFERCRFSLKPKNVSQFIEYVLKLNLFKVDKEKIRSLVREYKEDYSLKKYKKILRGLSSRGNWI